MITVLCCCAHMTALTFRSGDDSDGYWIGLNDIQQDNVWVWEDGSTFSFNFWETSQGQPNGDSEQNCVIGSWGKLMHAWQDTDCTASNTYICEYSTRMPQGRSLF